MIPSRRLERRMFPVGSITSWGTADHVFEGIVVEERESFRKLWIPELELDVTAHLDDLRRHARRR